MFELKNVKFKDILKINNLELKENEITCIIGKSGGGKTTFLKLLNNMISPTSGTIKFKGKNINNYDPVELRREIPMLPQNPVIFPGTIKDNFDLALKYAGLAIKNNKKYQKIMKTVGLENHKIDKSTEELSGGEKQRIALARILVLKPDILLLDEPSSALDEKTEELIIKTVVNYIENKKGTLIMITHSTKIAEKYGDKIVTINNGKVDRINQINEGGV